MRRAGVQWMFRLLGVWCGVWMMACGQPAGDPGESAKVEAPLRAVQYRARLAAGDDHSLALRPDGTVWAAGTNAAGQLGDGTLTSRSAPAQVPGLSGVVAVAAGGYHSLAVRSDTSVWTWGDNTYGQLGDGSTTGRSVPMQVPGLSGVSAVAGGEPYSLALRSDGTVWGWGDNASGQLGNGHPWYFTTPVRSLLY